MKMNSPSTSATNPPADLSSTSTNHSPGKMVALSDKTNNHSAGKMIALSDKKNTTNDAAEGFDLIGTESTIKRGKPSNTIPATKHVGMENFAPFSGSYSDSYSPF